MKIFDRKALQLVLSDVDKYFLWSATSDKSIFNFPSARSKGKDDRWTDIWSVLKASRKTRKCLTSLKTPLIQLNEQLQNAVKDFLNAENRLQTISRNITKEIHQKVISAIKFKKVQNVLRWIEKVFLTY